METKFLERKIKLSKYLKDNDLNQKTFCTLVGISRVSARKWLKGEVNISDSKWSHIETKLSEYKKSKLLDTTDINNSTNTLQSNPIDNNIDSHTYIEKHAGTNKQKIVTEIERLYELSKSRYGLDIDQLGNHINIPRVEIEQAVFNKVGDLKKVYTALDNLLGNECQKKIAQLESEVSRLNRIIQDLALKIASN